MAFVDFAFITSLLASKPALPAPAVTLAPGKAGNMPAARSLRIRSTLVTALA